jgi:hypothetical protein
VRDDDEHWQRSRDDDDVGEALRLRDHDHDVRDHHHTSVHLLDEHQLHVHVDFHVHIDFHVDLDIGPDVWQSPGVVEHFELVDYVDDR